jgi:hypothetical protein
VEIQKTSNFKVVFRVKFNRLDSNIFLLKSCAEFQNSPFSWRAVRVVTREEAEKIVETFVRSKRNCTELYVTSADSLGYDSWRIKGEYSMTVDGNPKTLYFEMVVDAHGNINSYDLNKSFPFF